MEAKRDNGIEANADSSTEIELRRSLLEHRGKFQIIVILLLSLNSIIVGINHTITAFHIYVPDFHCRDDPAEKCDYYVNGTQCPGGYDFNLADDNSVAVEFATVCDRSMLAPLINSLYFVGVTIGSLVCSSLCDVLGRRKLVVVCLYGQALMSLGQYFSGSLGWFIAFRLLQGFFIQGLQTCTYTLIMEYCPSRYRTITATYWEANWAVGLGILGLASFYIREWRLLTLILTLPAVISLAYIWFIPESIVWLQAKGRHTQAYQIMGKIAKFNGQHTILQETLSLARVKQEDAAERKRTDTESPSEAKFTFSDIIRNPILRKHLVSMICIWFSVTLSYYGILYYLPNMAGQRHLNFEIGALIEMTAYILAYFALSRFGRKIPMTFYQYSNGFLILLIAIFHTLPEGSYSKGWIVAITLIAKGLAVSSFCGMFIYCSELLPTVCRGLGLGLCGCSARCGSLLAPQLMALMLVVPKFIPLAIMSVLLLISGTVTLFLPETISTVLPNTIAEANELWRKKA